MKYNIRMKEQTLKQTENCGPNLFQANTFKPGERDTDDEKREKWGLKKVKNLKRSAINCVKFACNIFVVLTCRGVFTSGTSTEKGLSHLALPWSCLKVSVLAVLVQDWKWCDSVLGLPSTKRMNANKNQKQKQKMDFDVWHPFLTPLLN